MKYWMRATGRLVSHIGCDLLHPRARRFAFTKQWLSMGLEYDGRPQAPSLHWLDLYPQAETLELSLGELRFKRSNVTPFEMYCMMCIAVLRRPKRVFEIGTFDGATSLQFARTCGDCEVLTLDLAPEE